MKRAKKQSAIEVTLSALAAMLPEAAALYCEITSGPPSRRPVSAAALARMEQEADEKHLDLVRQVGGTFITPYDREDLFGLLESLDDIIDAFDLSGRTIVALPIVDLPNALVKSASHLQEMALVLSNAVHLIKSPEELVDALVQVNSHYGTIRTNYISYLAVALTDSASPIESLRGKVVAEQIEAIGGEMESFGRALAVMAIKET